MRYRTWAFLFAVFFVMSAFSALFPSKPETMVEVDFDTILRTGKMPGKKVSILGGELADDVIYTAKRDKLKEASFFLLAPNDVTEDSQKPEVKVLVNVRPPEDTTTEKLSEKLLALMPDHVEGCVGKTEDAGTMKKILDAGYRVKMPLLTISPCVEFTESSGQLWGFLALPIVLFGSYRFLRLYRLCYLTRKEELAVADESLLPSELSLNETVRTAKAGFGRWKLLRESFFDAAANYVPHLHLYRFKDSLPQDVARVSAGTVRQFLQAKKEGRLREHLLELCRNRHVIVSNGMALLLVIIAFGFCSGGQKNDEVMQLLIPAFIFGWAIFFKYLGIAKRKALIAVVLFSVGAFVLLVVLPDYMSKDGVLLKLPFMDDGMAVLHLDILSMPWAVLFAPLCYVMLVYLCRAITRYYTGGIEMNYAGRTVTFSDDE